MYRYYKFCVAQLSPVSFPQICSIEYFIYLLSSLFLSTNNYIQLQGLFQLILSISFVQAIYPQYILTRVIRIAQGICVGLSECSECLLNLHQSDLEIASAAIAQSVVHLVTLSMKYLICCHLVNCFH